jgi:hypothetical protein
MRNRLATSLAGVFLAVGSCADPNAQFATRIAADFAPAKHVVSVFGVFKDGRMSPDSWDDVGHSLSTAFSSDSCSTECRDELLTTNASLSSAIDDYVRANGIGDELLDAIAPAATGDVVVVFSIAGSVSNAQSQIDPDALHVGGPSTMMGGSRTRSGAAASMSPIARRSSGDEATGLDLSASVFSVPLHRSVAMLQMRYFGNSMGEATQQFAAKLRDALPGARCGAWDQTVRVGDKIRALAGS